MTAYVNIDHTAALTGKGQWVQATPLQETVFPAPGKHTASVILLHGFANSGAAWVPIAKHLQAALPHIKFLLPNAPLRTVHVPVDGKPGTTELPAWWDAHLGSGLPKNWPGASPVIDQAGLAEALATVNGLIDDETKLVGPGRVFLAGFSQGGVLSLAAGLENPKVGGIIVLSSWLPLPDAVKSVDAPAPSLLQKPIFIAHGTADSLNIDIAERSVEALVGLGFTKIEKSSTPKAGTVTWSVYEGLKHATNEEELQDIQKWLSVVAS